MQKAKEAAVTGRQTKKAAVDEQPEVPLKAQILEMWKAGSSRREIADHFEVPYQRVFAITKGQEGGPAEQQGRARVTVEASEKLTKAGHEELVGMGRAEAIRQLYTGDDEEFAGKLGPISRLLDTSYQVAFQATKSLRAGTTSEDEGEAEDAVDDGTEVEAEDTEDEDDLDLDDEDEDEDEDEDDDQ